MSPIFKLPSSYYGVTYKSGGKYEINLSPFIFGDKNALLVFIYHELAHVRYTNFELYEDGDELLAFNQCVDHNVIKSKTLNFVSKVGLNDMRYSHELVNSYANLSGNKIVECKEINL